METPDPDILRKPWKYIGYRGFSAFLASDNDFLIFRRFSNVTARVLLFLQDQITQLEEELTQLDDQHARKDAKPIHNGSFRQEAEPKRTQILNDINTKLREYNELLLQHSALRSHPPVPKKDIQSLKNWFHNTQNAILDEEAAYINHSTDLISLVPKSKTPLRQALERSTRFRLAKLWKKKRPKDEKGSIPYSDTVHYSSDARIDRFVGVTITLLGMIMLIAPLWILAVVKGTMSRLGVITVFIVVFLGLIACTTVARPFESLAAAAAYSAVLVVFLQIAG